MTKPKATPHGTINGYIHFKCRCVDCKAAMSERMRAINAANPEQNRARAKAWRDANLERSRATARAWQAANRERAKANRKAHYAANRQAMLLAAKQWQQENADRARATKRRWSRSNPSAVRESVERRRARKLAADTRLVSKRDWDRLVDRYRGCCAYCGQPKPLTQDHIIPLVRGGRHSIGNLLPACGSCNSSKQSKLLIEWRTGSC